MTSGGRLNEALFTGDTLNTPSMLCVEDALDGLRWAAAIGGLPALIARSEANLATIAAWQARSEWAAFLAAPDIRSSTSICLTIKAPWFQALDQAGQVAASRKLAGLLDAEGVAYDIASYRDAPAGFRIWGGATIEADDMVAFLPWLDWAVLETK